MIGYGRKETNNNKDVDPEDDEAVSLIRSSYKRTVQYFPDFIARMRAAGWNTVDAALMPGSAKGVLTGVMDSMIVNGLEEKKVR